MPETVQWRLLACLCMLKDPQLEVPRFQNVAWVHGADIRGNFGKLLFARRLPKHQYIETEASASEYSAL